APGRPSGTQVGPAELYVRVGAVTRTFPVPPGDAAGAGATVGLTTSGPSGPSGGEIFLDPAGPPGELVVGLAVPGPTGMARWEERIPFAHRPATGDLILLTPGLGWREVPSHPDRDWVPAAVRPTLTVTATAA
ncbi:hypothetical protein MXD58_024745, partial [Frankia sp. AgKG'84/4]|nr:hypothetical protein [Frankia sp. AgKG'84/4]